ncbi:MAG: TetR family transcriptional regulator, partial [Gemmatimonadota bacterium]
MKRAILSAAKLILIRKGLAAWTIEDVALEANCAKGLVNYHYKTKTRLLAQVAESLVDDRFERRVTALRNEGAAALDSLWHVLSA